MNFSVFLLVLGYGSSSEESPLSLRPAGTGHVFGYSSTGKGIESLEGVLIAIPTLLSRTDFILLI
jgi:hypothetical protein